MLYTPDEKTPLKPHLNALFLVSWQELFPDRLITSDNVCLWEVISNTIFVAVPTHNPIIAYYHKYLCLLPRYKLYISTSLLSTFQTCLAGCTLHGHATAILLPVRYTTSTSIAGACYKRTTVTRQKHLNENSYHT